jgi:hypothetical protein
LRNKKLKLALSISLISLMLMSSGCFYEVQDDQYEDYTEPEIPFGDDSGEPSYTPYEPPAEEIPETPVEPVNNSEPILVDDMQPPDDITWVSPGKVMIGNYHAGGRAEYPVTIHNGKDVAVEFLVYYKKPGHTAEGFVSAPEMVQDWIIIADPTPVLAARETRDVMVALVMPSSASDPAKDWEFWIGVKDNSQEGMVQTELCIRWLVSMRSN